jgi:thiol-disulfide isomerase/thioredoxin
LHRAFAIAPGGHWGWRSGLTDANQATEEALTACQENSELACLSYDLNGRTLLTAERWASALSPYPKAATQTGARRGQRLYDLRLADAHGQPVRIQGPAVRVSVVHFWGSWCPPCVKELPEIAQLQKKLAADASIRFHIIPLREPLSASQAWLRARGLELALSTAKSTPQHALLLDDGSALPDRQVAPVFPTTYILDAKGTILFAQHGPIHDWASLAPILRHAAKHGRR